MYCDDKSVINIAHNIGVNRRLARRNLILA